MSGDYGTVAYGTFASVPIYYVTSGHGEGTLAMDLRQKGPAFLSRLPAVHFAVCGLAIFGVGLIQVSWDAVSGRVSASAASGRGIAVTIAATAWLLTTAWLHREMARVGRRRLVLSQNDARMNLLGDSLLAGVAAAIIWRGHESPLAADRVWVVCPVVLAIAALSAIAIGLSRASSAVSSHAARWATWLIRGREILAAVLIAILAMLSVW